VALLFTAQSAENISEVQLKIFTELLALVIGKILLKEP
jgi:hypothetical protein